MDMQNPAANSRVREILALAIAIAIGPLFLIVGYSLHLVFGAGATSYLFVCAIVVPLLTAAGGRLKSVVWQLAIFSIILAVIGDNLRLNAIGGREILSVAFVSWVIGSVVSSPLPIYFILKPLPRRKRYLAGFVIALVAVALWIGTTFITK